MEEAGLDGGGTLGDGAGNETAKGGGVVAGQARRATSRVGREGIAITAVDVGVVVGELSLSVSDVCSLIDEWPTRLTSHNEAERATDAH